ncbi:MAG: hypothetical protein ACHQDD_02695 [Steroidobacterales bacterium]
MLKLEGIAVARLRCVHATTHPSTVASGYAFQTMNMIACTRESRTCAGPMTGRWSLNLRYCLSRVKNRGYGLGNELLPWARAFLASQVLNAKLLPPAFGMNRRAYWRHFHTPPDDWIYHRALEYLLPVVEFTESDYLAHGGGDVVTALRGFADAHRLHRRRAYLLVTHGLWGGYHHVQAARDFIRCTLYQSRYAANNLLQLRGRIDPHKLLVGMHVRLGDFSAPGAVHDYHRAANISLPIEWLCALARALDRALGDGWQLLLITDGSEEQLRPLTGHGTASRPTILRPATAPTCWRWRPLICWCVRCPHSARSRPFCRIRRICGFCRTFTGTRSRSIRSAITTPSATNPAARHGLPWSS